MALYVGTWPRERHRNDVVVPMNGTYATESVAVGALTQREDQRVALLPSGTLSSRMLDQVEISSGDRTQQVRLYALSGTEFTPTSSG